MLFSIITLINVECFEFAVELNTYKSTMYQHKLDVDTLNAVKTVLTANAQNFSQQTLYSVQHIQIKLTLIHCTFYCYADADQN